jgi:DNA-binding HxlR family transcriptional regulator
MTEVAASSVSPKVSGVRASSAARALNLIGDRWTLLTLYAAFMGETRFDGLVRLTGMARSLLVDRLARLETAGVLEKRPYQDRPVRHGYHLTAMGKDLYDAALMILRWETRWHYDETSPSHRIEHVTCGKPLVAELVCKACDRPVEAREVELVPGPGAGLEPAPRARLQRRSTAETAQPLTPMLERSIAVLGDRWTAHLLAAAFYGRRRFNDLQAELGAATNILADRLARLTALGMLERRLYQARPERWEYRLTDEARDLFPLIAALMAWGDRWLAGEAGPPEVLIHKPCGKVLETKVRCGACHGAVDVRSTRLSETLSHRERKGPAT